MRKKNVLSLILLFATIGVINSQTEKTKQLPSVAIGAGILSFNGDIGNGLNISSFSRIKTGYNIAVEQRIGNYLGVALNGIYGKLADGERSKTRNLNFQSQIIQADICVQFRFDNDLILKRSSVFAPYLFAGFGYLKFDPKGDLTDKNGTKYNYWADGSIRSLPESDANAASSTFLQRDYTYETKLTDSTTNYARGAFSIPMGLAFNLKMLDNLSANIGATYYMTLTDWIDNVKGGKNDSYVFANVSLQYTFTKKEKITSSKNYENVDFSSLDKMDTDEDAVNDANDRCPGTPKGVKVDAHGCPEDNDEDGVPDYMDKELMTKKGALVDANGITQTDKMIADHQASFDSLATERSDVFNQNPSLAYLKDLDAKATDARKNNTAKTSNIPAALKSADKNNDGYISSDEITAAIDAFFDGSSDFTVERLNDLVDYFFEQ
jgi:hypothetical protein